ARGLSCSSLYAFLNLARCRGSRRCSTARRRCTRSPLRLSVRRVAVEGARRRELAELVTDHFLGHLHRNVLVAVVDTEEKPDELRQDRRAAAPDPDHLVAARSARGFRLLEQIAVDERTFPNRTRHDACLTSSCGRGGSPR